MPTTQRVQQKGNHSQQARNAEASQKAALAARMRASKVTYDQIAKQVGYSDRSSAYHAVQRELKRIVVENIDELRREELASLDLMQRECMSIFLDPNAKGRLFAVDRVLAIMQRRARLMGYEPTDDAKEKDAQQVIIREIPQGWLVLPPATIVDAEEEKHAS